MFEILVKILHLFLFFGLFTLYWKIFNRSIFQIILIDLYFDYGKVFFAFMFNKKWNFYLSAKLKLYRFLNNFKIKIKLTDTWNSFLREKQTNQFKCVKNIYLTAKLRFYYCTKNAKTPLLNSVVSFVSWHH